MVTAQDESSAETADRIREYLNSVNEGSRKCQRTAFTRNYERLETAAEWELSTTHLAQAPSSSSGGNLAASAPTIVTPEVQRVAPSQAPSQASSSAGPHLGGEHYQSGEAFMRLGHTHYFSDSA